MREGQASSAWRGRLQGRKAIVATIKEKTMGADVTQV